MQRLLDYTTLQMLVSTNQRGQNTRKSEPPRFGSSTPCDYCAPEPISQRFGLGSIESKVQSFVLQFKAGMRSTGKCFPSSLWQSTFCLVFGRGQLFQAVDRFASGFLCC
ncbi:Hypothetical_protein [Hexamita inflata]|uniref:Hypothetical_protein n=1 Tax=Hexamita inflata TaxID=28002 RepID=A0AA86RDZ1_9EUKA|nr:Hypothetical protein HINF_LOCUS59018 [Hexamita inflata]